MVSKVYIKSLELVYYAPSPEAEITYIIPVYVIKGILVGKDGSVAEFAQFISAIKS